MYMMSEQKFNFEMLSKEKRFSLGIEMDTSKKRIIQTVQRLSICFLFCRVAEKTPKNGYLKLN